MLESDDEEIGSDNKDIGPDDDVIRLEGKDIGSGDEIFKLESKKSNQIIKSLSQIAKRSG